MNARWLCVGAIVAGFCAAMGLSAIAPLSAGQPEQREHQREIFIEGWEAARRGDHPAILHALGNLDGYPLAPYLEFELLRQRIDEVPEGVMEKFLARYRDWSFAGTLETSWLRSLGRRGKTGALLRHGRESADTEVRCHVAGARIERGEVEGIEAELESLWTVGRSQPDACDASFSWWRRQGNPGADTAWTRFRLALEAGQAGLARYLRRYLTSDQREWADRWLNMRTRPHVTLRQARQWHDHERSRELIAAGIRTLAGSDWERARDNWRILESRFDWSDSERSSIERELALFQAVALDAGAVAAIDALPASARDQQMLEWRARAAMAGDDWAEVLESIRAMPVAEQARSRWRYWRGRALAGLQRADALVAFASLTAETGYYGFLASAWLGQGPSLCHQSLSVDDGLQRRLMRDVEFERAMELFQVGLHGHARRTWARMHDRLSRAELEQAALLAAREGWYDRTISALNRTGNRRAYPWRFPLMEKGRVLSEASARNVNPALIYGLMRAESAMQPDALSPAGARGLLQLMPGTAREVARRNGIAYNGTAQLMDPAVNIRLGVAHLAELQVRYDGDWVLVAAAYNAGVHAVERWLEQRPSTPSDVWIETMPFYETRDYVPRVLAFATIYEWQLDQSPRVLAEHALEEGTVSERFVCAESDGDGHTASARASPE